MNLQRVRSSINACQSHIPGLGKFNSSVLSWSPLAPVLNPFNQDSYNNLWSQQVATCLSAWGCIYRPSEVGNGLYILKSALQPCLKSIVLCLLNPYGDFAFCFDIHLFIYSLRLSADINILLMHPTKISNLWVDFFLSVFEAEV